MNLEGIILVYANLIKKGMKSIEEVPENIREEVEKILI